MAHLRQSDASCSYRQPPSKSNARLVLNRSTSRRREPITIGTLTMAQILHTPWKLRIWVRTCQGMIKSHILREQDV